MKRFTIFLALALIFNTHNYSQSSHTYSDIFFLDDHIGWILSNDSYLWKTTNAGADWIRIFDPQITASGKITFADEQNGWMIFDNNLFHSTNGGFNWNPEYQFSPIFGGYDVTFINDSIGFAYSNNRLFKSVDSGNNWELVTDTLQHIYDVSFYKDSVGYLCFTKANPNFVLSDNYINKTTDKGESWSFSAFQGGGLNITVYFDKINCLSKNDCIVGSYFESMFGVEFKIVKTSDTGSTWESMPCYGCWALDLEFITPQEGWLVSWSGIMNTTDGGNSWDTLQTFTNWEDRNANFEFFSSNISYLINLNNIYYTDDGWITFSIVDSIVTDIEQDKNQITPAEFELCQNYPNPFNPSTRIIFEIPGQARNDNTHVILKVYDVLGNEVATLVNEYKSAGVYEVDFNGSSLSSGIYFYKLHTGDFTKTNKMILLK